jgi:fatty-acyl-CoA synthase
VNNQGLGSWPARRARATPDRTATIHHGRRPSYAELHERVRGLARGLRGLGIGAGTRVAYLGPNHPAFLETMFAAGSAAAVFVPLNTRLAVAELAYQLDDAGVDVLVHADKTAPHAAELQAQRPALVLVGLDDPGPQGYDALVATAAAGPDPDPVVAADDDAIIMYTSGTTGRPKGAQLTHGNITWNAINVLVDVDLAATEITLLSAPLFHTAALGMTCLPTLLKGGTLILEEAFDVDRTFDLIEAEHVTFAFGVPTMFDALARSPRWPDADLASLRFLLCGGAPVPRELLERYQQRGLTFMQGYGMTEASPSVLLLSATDSPHHIGSAGKPAFFTDVRLETPEGTPAEPGEPGELVVEGPNVIPGYWQRPDANDTSFTPDGWFRSGDVATVDDQGFHRIVDRSKDMFISGGENVYPAEVETVLHDHPGVVDAAVIGVPDPTWGEVGHAVVVTSTGDLDEAELTAFAADRLGKYKVPKFVTVVAELPRNPTGKLDKVALRRDHGRQP